MPNGVDMAAAAAAPSGFRDRLHIARDAFVLAFVGRIHPIKRLDLAAAAFAHVRESHPSVHLVVAGGDERGLLAGIVRGLSAHAGFVHAIGELNEADTWALLRDADALVQCSDSESFGLAVVEAMASGVPVVATRTCPWPEIETRRCGYWVEQSAPAIADAVGRLVDDPASAAAMGKRGAAFARERFEWDSIGQRMAAVYENMLVRGRRHIVA